MAPQLFKKEEEEVSSLHYAIKIEYVERGEVKKTQRDRSHVQYANHGGFCLLRSRHDSSNWGIVSS